MKRIISIVAGLFVFAAAFGQSFLDKITLSLDKGSDGIYAKGETIRVFADSQIETPALVKIFINGKLKDTHEATLSVGRSEVFSGNYDESTALMVRITNPSSLKDSTTIGAVVAPEEFRPGFEEPADFREFWAGQIADMRKMRMKAKLTPVELSGEDADNYVCYDLQINCVGSAPVSGYLAMPKGAAAKSLPIAIYAHSAGDLRKEWTHSTVKKALSLAKTGKGAIALDINAHGMLNGQDESYYEEKQKELKGYATQIVTNHEEYYFRTMFLRLVRSLDYLCTFKEWDGKRVLITGGSQGGAQSAALAGLDSRVTMVVVDVPAMWDMGGALLGRTSAWTKPLERNGLDSPAVKIIPYYDASNFMRYYKGELVVNVGLIDLTCPPAGVWSVFNVCPSESKEIHPCAWKGHSGKYSLPKPMQDQVKKAMNKIQSDAINAYLQ